MTKVLITGATGLVGGHLCQMLDDYELVSAGRSSPGNLAQHFTLLIGGDTDYSACLQDIEVVIHCAALSSYTGNDDVALQKLRDVNVAGTLKLARQAAEQGVRRFIFISSIKVNGEETLENSPFTEVSDTNPQDPYGQSKLDAEKALMDLASQFPMEIVVIRPPLVYGSGVAGNFAAIAKLLETKLPLPFAATTNKRSFIAVDNLISFIRTCIRHPAAANEVFCVSDDQDLSTAELFSLVATALSIKVWLIYIPVSVLSFMASVLGKRALARRLLGSLQVDISKARNLLGWQPPVTVESAMKRCFNKRS